MFQFFYLISELSVEQNILMPLAIKNARIDREWYDRILEVLQIRNLVKRNASKLSGGEKQRVAIARAVINKPDYIIADEPTGNLDSMNSKRVISLIEDLRRESDIGVILATHEKDLINTGDVKLHLEDGVIKS